MIRSRRSSTSSSSTRSESRRNLNPSDHDDASDSTSSNSNSAPTPLLPQILTSSSIQLLTTSGSHAKFDASDTLECYLLVRDSYLHGLANSSIPIRKLALGIRYRPPFFALVSNDQKSLELTLEYGPMRAGAFLNHETIPRVITADQEDGAYVTWENEARVFYNLRIEGYRSATYMASMTGAVLTNLLQEAVLYPAKSHRRYQPFSVYAAAASSSSSSTSSADGDATDSETLLLRSSSDVDFISALWQHLTELGVELKPVMLPPQWRVRLWATDIRRVQRGGTVGELREYRNMVDFYTQFYQCVEAIATANYSALDDSSSTTTTTTTTAATTASTPAPSNGRYLQESATQNATSTTSTTNTTTTNTTNQPQQQVLPTTEPSMLPTSKPTLNSSSQEDFLTASGSYRPTLSPSPFSVLQGFSNNETAVSTTASSKPSVQELKQQQDIEQQEQQQQQQQEQQQQPPPGTTDTDQVAQDAAKAAQDAENAAQEAQNSGNQQAAAAAQAAADAAKKAAHSTRGQAAMVAQKALLSGDGGAMTETLISQCLSPTSWLQASRFGGGGGAISGNSNTTTNINNTFSKNSTTVYLYWDGTFYYVMNLTAPYVQIVPETSQLPRPIQLDLQAKGDMVDWALAFVVLAMFVVGFVCLLQKVLGRRMQVIRPLFRFQRWFFDPVHYTLDDTMLDDSEHIERGQGHTYTFGQDVIPLSMGGIMAWRQEYFPGDPTENTYDELEMIAPAMRSRASSAGDVSSGDELYYSGSENRSLDDLKEATTRPMRMDGSHASYLLRNPDFVALPDLKSTSKVAVPVSIHSLASLHDDDL